MIVTNENYYSTEADNEYISCSQYQNFLECEAKAIAKLQGRWRDASKEAFLVGNYFHSYFEGEAAHKAFCDEHYDDIYKYRIDKKTGEVKEGGKYAAYAAADKMIQTAVNDPLIRELINIDGKHEYVMTGQLFGMEWKIRMDKYIEDYMGRRMILDYKTAASLTELKYNPETRERETFIQTYGYLMRAAVYSEIVKQNTLDSDDPFFIIIAISKQEYPDKGVYSLNHRDMWDIELIKIEQNMANIRRLKEGSLKPRRCDICDYCRATKILTKIEPYYKLIPQFREGREEDANAGEVLEDAQEAC